MKLEQTKYYCDDCKNEVPCKRDLYLVKAAIHKDNSVLVVGHKEHDSNFEEDTHETLRALWCRGCRRNGS